MNPRMLERLDYLAAERERTLAQEVERQQAVLAQIAQQREVLASYRARLTGWADGGIVRAAQAQSADRFVTASHGVEIQLDQAEARARSALAAALAALAAEQARRQQLEAAQARVAASAERAAEQRRERAQPWRPANGRTGF